MKFKGFVKPDSYYTIELKTRWGGSVLTMYDSENNEIWSCDDSKSNTSNMDILREILWNWRQHDRVDLDSMNDDEMYVYNHLIALEHYLNKK